VPSCAAALSDLCCRFIISYFLLDQTISIFEPRVPNTGIPGGKFLERIKVKKEGEVSLCAACVDANESEGVRNAIKKVFMGWPGNDPG